MRKFLFILLFIPFFSYSQEREQSIVWLKVQDVTNTRYFIWHGDTINFTPIVNGYYLTEDDSTLKYVTVKQLVDSMATLAGGHNPVTLGTSATNGGLSLSNQEISFQNATSSRSGYITSSDFSDFSNKLSVVSHDETLTGYGTEANPLSANTTKVALRTWVTDNFLTFDYLDYDSLTNTPVIPTVSDIAYGISWDGNTDATTKNTIYDVIQSIGATGTDLSYSAYPDSGIVVSSTGNDVTLPAGSLVNASLMLPDDKSKLDSLLALAFLTSEVDPVYAGDSANIVWFSNLTDGSLNVNFNSIQINDTSITNYVVNIVEGSDTVNFNLITINDTTLFNYIINTNENYAINFNPTLVTINDSDIITYIINHIDAGDITVIDAGDYFTSTNIENVLQEIGLALQTAGTDDQTASEVPISDPGNIITATDVEYALQENRTAIDAIEAWDATDIPINDPGGLYTATDVEYALQEVMTEVNTLSGLSYGTSGQIPFTSATGDGYNYSDNLRYISGNLYPYSLYLTDIASPGEPSSGYGRLASKSDGTLHYLRNGGYDYNLTSDTDSTNEIQTLSISNDTLFLSVSNDTIKLPSTGGSSYMSDLDTVVQTSHGLSANNAVYLDSITYKKAISNNDTTAAAVGVVRSVIDANTFVLQSDGDLPGSWISGTHYFLSNTTSGLISTLPSSYNVGDVFQYIGTGKPDGSLHIEIDVGKLITSAGFSESDPIYSADSSNINTRLANIENDTTNYQTAYTDRLKWDGGATGLTASTGRTSLGATTIGSNIFTKTNPSAITFLRANADNTVDFLNASNFRTAIDVDQSGTDNSTNVTLAGSGLYLSLSGQEITRSLIDTTTSHINRTNFINFIGNHSSGGTTQTLSTTGAAGNISISDGNTINLNINDADASPTNEIQGAISNGGLRTSSGDFGMSLINSPQITPSSVSWIAGWRIVDDNEYGSYRISDIDVDWLNLSPLIPDRTALTSGLVSTDELLVSDAGTPKKMDISVLQDYMQANLSFSGGGAPTNATYITQTPDATLSAEQALSSLSTGILKVTNGTGVLSTAVSGTDYQAPLTFGISNTNVMKAENTPADNDFAKFTATGLEGRSYSEVKTDLSLNNVENTALSTYTGSGGALDNQYITNGAGYVNYHSKAITVESPTSSEDISMFFTDVAITVSKMVAVLNGSSTPSVTWTIRHSTDRSGTGNQIVTGGTTTTSTTTGSVVTSFNDATIPANSFVWLETTAQSGTVTAINITLKYTDD